jgi:hypothetical protein
MMGFLSVLCLDLISITIYKSKENSMGDSIQLFFTEAAKSWGSYVLALSIVGGITMSLLETIKNLLPVRQWFQRYKLRKFIEDGAARGRGTFNNSDLSAEDAENDLLTLSVNGDSAALFDLPIEQLCGQFTAAIQVVLDFPLAHVDLLEVTASRAMPDDIKIVLGAPPNPPTPQYIDARNRVTNQCRRAIDAFQISAGFRWKWILQLASIFMSGLLTWLALSYNAAPVTANPVSILSSAVLAGFLAPVAKDLLAVVQKARGQ